MHYLIGRQARTQHGPDNSWVDIIRKNCQVPGVERDILLKTAILMMQVICAFDAVLLISREAEFAPSTDSANKSDANKHA